MKKHTFVLLVFILVMLFGACGVSNEETSSGSGQESVENQESVESAANDNQSSEEESGVTSEIEEEEVSKLNVPTQIVDGDYDFTGWDASRLSRSPQIDFWNVCLGTTELLYLYAGDTGLAQIYTMTPEGEITEYGETPWMGSGIQCTEAEGTWYLMHNTLEWKLYTLQEGKIVELYEYPENGTERFYEISTNEILIAEDTLYYAYSLIDRASQSMNQKIAGGIGQIDLTTGEKSVWLQEEGMVSYRLITAANDHIVYEKTTDDSQTSVFFRGVREGETVYIQTLPEIGLDCSPVGHVIYYAKDGMLQAMDVSDGHVEPITETVEDEHVVYADENRILCESLDSVFLYDIQGNLEQTFSKNRNEERVEERDLCGIWKDRLIWAETYMEEEKTVFFLFSTDLEGQNRQDIGKLRG